MATDTPHTFELLAPGGDIDSIKAAIVAGADAIYCGLDNFNARNRAANISFDLLEELLVIAHAHQCKLFLTLNIVILEKEMPALLRLLNRLANTTIDGVIVQDLGLFDILAKHYPSLDVHASTQVNTHNEGQIKFLHQLNASRVNLSRELELTEIDHLTQIAHQHHMQIEVFVHGSYCIGFSGLCYFSSVKKGASGNRGRCSQPCRDQYQTTRVGKNYPFNLKDNSAYHDFDALAKIGVDSLKIEGRIKKSHYVYTTVDSWRKQIDTYQQTNTLLTDTTALYTVYNRDFSNAFLRGSIGADMYIDNPRDNSADHFAALAKAGDEAQIKTIKTRLYDTKTEIIETLNQKISQLSVNANPITINVIAQVSQPLLIQISGADVDISVSSRSELKRADKHGLSQQEISQRLNTIADHQYPIAEICFQDFDSQLFLPFKELIALRDELAFLLRGAKPHMPAVDKIPLLERARQTQAPKLSVLINDERDIGLYMPSDVELFYQLPESIAHNFDKLVALFNQHTALLPWFPAVLIGDNYQAAVELLKTISARLLVTNNSGVGFAAAQLGLQWLAGPLLNTTNSYSIQALKQEFNCAGAFISNELNRAEMRHLVKPDNFELCYSIYHPNLLLESRQCLFLQTRGCRKTQIDDKCLDRCQKSTEVLSLESDAFIIDKQRGSHNNLYAQQHFMNTEIVTQMPQFFGRYLIDMRAINTHTHIEVSPFELVTLFKRFIAGDIEAGLQLQSVVTQTSCQQYHKGL